MKKKMLTAAVLTAALALGTAPAFAGENDVELGNATITKDNKTTGTTVSVETTISQIDVQLPLTMTIATPTAGGTTTTPSGYKIVNKSIFPIKVSKAQSKAETGWTLADGEIAANTAPSEGTTIGDLYLKLQPSGKSAWTVSTTSYTPTDWKIGGATTDAGTALDITLTGTNSKLAKTFNGATQAVSLTYTIEADSETPATSE